MKTFLERKPLKKTVLMVAWMCGISALFQFPPIPVWGDGQTQQFQGVVIEKDAGTRVIYVNEVKVVVPKGAEITTSRDVRLSFQSLRPKQWVFIQAHLEGESLVADKIVCIPRYIPPKERGKYRFFTQTGSKK